MKRLLIVEDDQSLNQGLCLALKDERLQIISCFDIKSAQEYLLHSTFDLILLDINLPDGDGLALLGEIKSKNPNLPVILLTAKDTEMDIVTGLEHGADDYITKPFSLAILRARVHTQLRRELSFVSTLFVMDDYQFDFDQMIFLLGDNPVELSKTEQKLLRILIENQGKTVSRDILLDRIWTDGANYVDENALSVAVKRLRDKLDAAEYIKTVYGIGYMWVVK